jgi:hypothetical protein
MRGLLLGLATIGLAHGAVGSRPACAQSGADYTPPAHTAPRALVGSRLINLPTPTTIAPRRWELYFGHRFRGTINHGGDGHNLWGLDGGADVTLGVGYGLTDWLDVSLQRARVEEDFELAVKAALWREQGGAPLSVAVRAGVDRLQRENALDPTRPFVQLALSRTVVDRLQVFVSPSWVRDTPRLRDAFNVPLGVSLRVRPDTRFEIEYVPENGDLDESVAAWHLGFAKTVGGHLFKVFVGNSGATAVDQILGGDSVARYRSGDIRLGFNLVRYLPR